MQKVQPLIIDEVQSAVVKERLITDNVIAAFEVFHWMKTIKRSPGKVFWLKIGYAQSGHWPLAKMV